jgi:hypothetical protein
MQTFAWQGFEFKHPSDWECVRFSKNRARGECALADPRGRRMSVFWNSVKGSVDPAKLLKEAAQQLQKSDPQGKITENEWNGPDRWRGFQWKGAEFLTVALRYFAETGLLMQTQFYSDRKRDEESVRRVLETVRCQYSQQNWQWNAFGCRVLLPSTFATTHCEIFPGRASLTFSTTGRKAQKLRIERLAVPESQLKGRTLQQWFAGTLEDSRRIRSCCDGVIHGHACLNVDLKPDRPSVMQFLTRVPRAARASAWICEKEARLYRAQWQGAAEAVPNFSAIVECCRHA